MLIYLDLKLLDLNLSQDRHWSSYPSSEPTSIYRPGCAAMSGSEQPVYLPTTQQLSDKAVPPEPDQLVHDSSLSIYQRLRHFLYINFVLNKRSFILSILSYCADILLFVSLNLYLVANKSFTYERVCISTSLNGTRLSRIRRDLSNESTRALDSNTTTKTIIQTTTSPIEVYNNSSKSSRGL